MCAQSLIYQNLASKLSVPYQIPPIPPACASSIFPRLSSSPLHTGSHHHPPHRRLAQLSFPHSKLKADDLRRCRILLPLRPSPLRGSTIALTPPLQLTSHRFQRPPGAIPSSFAGTGATAMDGGGNSIMVSQSTDASPVDSSATTAATPIDDPKQNLTQVINSIQKTLGTLHQLYLTISSYNVASQLPLLQRMNNLVLELDNMTRLAEKCNIQVPMEVLNLIDEGKNPDEFTRDMLNGCIAKNQITKGKTDAFKGLRKHLLEELEQTFPGEVETYREIRAASASEAKRYAQSQSQSQSQNMLPNGDAKIKTEI